MSLPASRLSPTISAPLYANSAASCSGAVRTDPINSLRHEWSHLSLSVYVLVPLVGLTTPIYTCTYTYIHQNTRKVFAYYARLTYLDPHAPTLPPVRVSTKWRGRPYCDNERINALEVDRAAILLRTRCQPRVRRRGGVFSIRKVSSGPRLLPTAIWNPLGVHTLHSVFSV